ncbi:MAG TPA: GNAT family N-acetyltransferase [Acidimicrobiales bacterium]|nr:GNAT family N-acetyltransferase [Acidimicrobiales bacterium]
MTERQAEQPPLEFRPLVETDLVIVSDWLSAEHVRRWWRDPADIGAVRAKYVPRIAGEEPTEVFMVALGDEPIGLIQRYRFSDYGKWAATVAGTDLVFPSAAGIDYLIGVDEHTGRGLGTEMIRSFTDRLFEEYADVRTILVTPQHGNRASCRALERAGYSLAWVGDLDSDDPADAGESAIYVKHRSDGVPA